MKVLSSWLNDITGLKLSAEEQAERLERAGIELEQIISSTKYDDKIVVARVNKVTQHPNADKLKICEVSTGKADYHIVCGAPNVSAGMLVPLAKIGAVLPDSTEIKRASIRGEESEGMLCSAKELGVSDDHSGILELNPATPVGATLCDVWDSGDILDLTSAHNRSDLLSSVGLSRELAAFSGQRLGEKQVSRPSGKPNSRLTGEIDKNVVKRYLLAHVKLGKSGETPKWMSQRLVASGLRPINIVVDITNYVMLETGQPLHAFDAANVKLPVSVRLPRRGEQKLTTLDGIVRDLNENDVLICDATTPLALAGVMGGLTSEIIPETAEIYLEAATFVGRTVRETAVRQGLRSEASARFERDLPAELVAVGLERALELLVEHCSAELVAVSEDGWKAGKPTVIEVKPKRIGDLLGRGVSAAQSQKALELLGFDVKDAKASLLVTVPYWRPDVTQFEDIVEEVGRSLGYDDLPATLPAWAPAQVDFDTHYSRLWQLKAAMRGLGLDEVVTYSFVSHKQLADFGQKHIEHLKLKNPMSLEQAYLRSTLAPSLLGAVAANARQVSDVAVYEVSKVFEAGADKSKLPAEPLHLGVAVLDDNSFAKAKSAVDLIEREFKLGLRVVPKEHAWFAPGRLAEVLRGEKSLGYLGEFSDKLLAAHKLRGRVGYLELELSSWLDDQLQFSYKPVSRFPSIVRDLSLVVDRSVTWAAVKNSIRGENLQAVEFLSDYYGKELGEGKKALAVRLVLGSLERTLTDAEADATADKVAKHLISKFDATLRD